MTPVEQIATLRQLLAVSEAQNLHWFRRVHEGVQETWDDLPAEEREARIWYAEHLLKREHPELFA